MAVVELSFKNPVVTCFAFYVTVCILKLIAVGLLTSYNRISKKVSLERNYHYYIIIIIIIIIIWGLDDVCEWYTRRYDCENV